MKRVTRFLASLVSGISLALFCLNGTAYAEENLDIDISSPKTSYSSGEEVKFDVKVKNNYSYDIDAKLSASIDGKMKITSNGTQNITLSPGNEKTYSVICKADTPVTTVPNADSPKTSDTTPVVLYFAGLTSALCFVLLLKKSKRSRQIMSLLLVCAIGLEFTSSDFAAMKAYAEQISISKSMKVKYDNTDITLKLNAEYETNNEVQIELKTDNMSLRSSSDGDYYLINDEVKIVSGIARNIGKVDKMSYSIADGTGVIKEGKIDKAEEWKISDCGFGLGYNALEIITTSGNQEKKFKFNIMNSNLANMDNAGIDYKTDTDKDRVPDYIEEKHGMDKSNSDSDGDGLDDYIEMMIPSLSPLSRDSNDNGVSDADEDYDEDGLRNYDEVNVYHTDCSLADTDSDTLSDYDEIFVYKTDPNKKDTDGDGLNDNDELRIGSDPLIPETSFSETLDIPADDQHSTAVKVTVDDLTAAQVTSFSAARSTLYALTDPNIPGFIDSGYNFTVNGTISGADVEVTYDPAIESEECKPALYYYNEETEFLELVENQIHENGKVKAHLEHFSQYILINSIKYAEVWEYLFVQEEDDEQFDGLDIAFVIDDSGSMTSNDANNIRVDVTKEFIQKLTDNDRGAVISFTSGSTVLSQFTNDKNVLTAATDNLWSYGGTNLSSGISQALSMFDGLGSSENKLKYIVMLTDGQGSYNTSLTTQSLNSNIVIHTIGLGNSVDSYVLTAMAEGTGGQYYPVDKADDLYYIFETIAEKADYHKDTDGDGISDYYEKEMAAGHLVLGNGVPLTSVSYMNEDSDGDGLKDGEEIKIVKLSSFVYVKMTSNPGITDTDGDTMNDPDDPYPLVPSNPQTELIHQSKNYEGLKMDTEYYQNIVADDLTFNNRSYTQIVSDCSFVGTVAWITPEFMMWDELYSLFFVGVSDLDLDLEATLFDMLDTFKYNSNKGTVVNVGDQYDSSLYPTYKDSVLTNRAENYDAYSSFVDSVKEIVIDKLQAYSGDLNSIKSTGRQSGVISDEIGSRLTKPQFSLGDSRGLTLAIHDFQGYTITVKDYVFDGTNFSGKLLFHFYDHFGLDADDYQQHFGFCDWYTLQHYDRFDGEHCPFIVVIDTEVDFSGTI